MRAGAAWLIAALGLAGCVSEQAGGPAGPPVAAVAPRIAPERANDRDHAALVAAYGGEYRAPRAKAMLEEVVGRLVRHTERPDESYAVTILDSPVANAFALPSGRLYVTRGLLALANDTSEIAAVVAHEIAHVTRRHALARGELEARSILVSRVEADVLGKRAAGSAMRDRSRSMLAGFSRAQEFEADAVGISTLGAAGYDPYAASRFLRTLDRSSALATRDGSAAQASSPDMPSTHPATAERVALAIKAARQIGAPGVGRAERDAYLGATDGIRFGDNPADGLVRGRRFVHPRLGVMFEAPAGYTLENTPRAVLGATADGACRLLFDAADLPAGQSLADLLTTTWTDAIEPGSIENRTVNGFEAATARSRGSDWTFRLAAVRVGATTYRLILAGRITEGGAEEDRIVHDFEATLGSVATAGAGAVGLRPTRLALVRAEPGDTSAALADRMAIDRPLERFLVLNGLGNGAPLQVGERYKIVVEEDEARPPS